MDPIDRIKAQMDAAQESQRARRAERVIERRRVFTSAEYLRTNRNAAIVAGVAVLVVGGALLSFLSGQKNAPPAVFRAEYFPLWTQDMGPDARAAGVNVGSPADTVHFRETPMPHGFPAGASWLDAAMKPVLTEWARRFGPGGSVLVTDLRDGSETQWFLTQ